MYKRSVYAYSSGLFDGEGYIGIIESHNQSGSITYSCTCELSSTSKEIIDWLVATHGGILNEVKRKGTRPPWKQQWKWVLRRRKGLRTFLRYIEYYSIIKRDQVKLAREFMAGEIKPRAAFERMKELNHRGTAISSVKNISASDHTST